MSSTVRLLNQLLTLHHRSFAQYLAEVGRWYDPSALDDPADRALRAVVFDHQATARRVAAAIVAAGGSIECGPFPMEFTDKNDLASDYLLGEVLESERRDAATIEQILRRLPADAAEARELAEESLGAAQAHIETLQGLAARQVGV